MGVDGADADAGAAVAAVDAVDVVGEPSVAVVIAEQLVLQHAVHYEPVMLVRVPATLVAVTPACLQAPERLRGLAAANFASTATADSEERVVPEVATVMQH